jgi:2',3'-cyclic-nucleotide 2'-phosphodiesterase (5'-nucleotidase family)
MSNFTLQLLHHADFEGNTNALTDAPRLAALMDHFDDTYVGNTLKLSGGDNWIPSPWYNAQSASQSALADAVRGAYEEDLGLEAGALANLAIGPGAVDQAIINLLGIQASALGNHEFDQGPDDVARIINPRNSSTDATDWASVTNIGSYFPYITSNLDFSGSSDLSEAFTSDVLDVSRFGLDQYASDTDISAGLVSNGAKTIAPAATVEIDGEIIGLVGATTQRLASISSPGDVSVIGASADDMDLLATQIQAQVDALTAQGINKIIAITHLQDYQNEKLLAGKLSGVDIILSAGSDAIFVDANDTVKVGDTVNENFYPLALNDKDGRPTLLVSTDGQYNYLGRLVVEFDSNGQVITNSIDAEESGAYATTDAVLSSVLGESDPYAVGSMAARVKSVVDAVDGIIGEKLANVAGYTSVYLNGVRSSVRNEETNLGNLTADANLAFAQKLIDANPGVLREGFLVSMKNAGGIRSDIGLALGVAGAEAPVGGEVSQLDIETALAFNNGLVMYPTTVDGLVALLEHGLSKSGLTQGQFPQIGGMRIAYDPTLSAGERLRSLEITDIAGNLTATVMQDGVLVVDGASPVNMVSLDFLVKRDGDDYPFSEYLDGSVIDLYGDEDSGYDVEGFEQDALADYLSENHGSLARPFASADTEKSADERIVNLFPNRANIGETSLAFDLDGNAGIVVKLIGAIFGSETLANQEYVGIGLRALDTGVTQGALIELALQAASLNAASDRVLIETVYDNLFGQAPDAQTIQVLDGLIGAALSRSDFVAAAMETSANIENVGLNTMTSIEFI